MTKQKQPVRFWVGALGTLGLVVAPLVAMSGAMVGCTAHVGPRRPVVKKKVVVRRPVVVKKKTVIVR